VRASALITTLSTIAAAACSPALATASTTDSAVAAATGGTTAAPSSASKSSSADSHANTVKQGAATKSDALDAPITAPTPKLEYHGPVFQLLEGKVVPYVAPPPANTVLGSTGGDPVAASAEGRPKLLVPGSTAELIDGLAAAPEAAPKSIDSMIWAANQIIGKPYVYGGGHGSFKSFGYDCSGTVSFALHGASLIKIPMDSSEMMHWGEKGIGRWVTIFANPGHAYMTIAGLRLDTSPVDDPSNQNGPRWRPLRPENAGFVMRHPEGL
jgi:cell wall-associated NlpC family hydrolase